MKRSFRSLEVVAKTNIDTFGSGSHISSLKDSVIDVDVVREYQPGDKRLDSRSSLRTGKTMSRVFVPDRNMSIFVALDTSSSQASRLDCSVIAGLYLSYLADLGNDKLGAMLFAEEVEEFILPSEDAGQTIQALESFYNRPARTAGTNLAHAIQEMNKFHFTDSLIVFISDFCYPLDDKTLNSLRYLGGNKNTKVVCLVMHNRREWDLHKLPFAINFQDSESNARSYVDLRHTEPLYLKWRQEVRENLLRANVTPLFIDTTAEQFLLPLVHYFLRR